MPDGCDDRKDRDGSWSGAFEVAEALLWVARAVWALIAWVASLAGE